MARDYLKSKKGQMVTIHGFEEMLEVLTAMEKQGVNEVTSRTFDKCCSVIKESMDKFVYAAVPAELANKQTEFKSVSGNRFMYAYGFNKTKDPDAFLKACYLNYGTPRRKTKRGYNRGKIEARYFISNGKRAAARRLKILQKHMMKEIVEGIKDEAKTA